MLYEKEYAEDDVIKNILQNASVHATKSLSIYPRAEYLEPSGH